MQEATEDHKEQEDKQNDNAYLAHELTSQQDEEPNVQQEDDLSIAGDDSMADQADEPDSDDDEDNALEQKDHDEDDDQLSAQGKTI